ncbi:MAG: hypothetical protein A2Y65_07545 [Deltaproteobacteria bacterium RBG_13_52_11]|nr:MAG: hypothetical protein A2Y65_07545 [Deltaproteobacteria bacterium RBG_13_52_11]
MRHFFVLLVLLSLIGAATSGLAQEQAAPFAIAQFDKDRLLNRLADLKPFQAEKRGTVPGYAFPVTKEEFRNSLLFLSSERTDEVMNAFGIALAFSFKDNTQFLILTQWRDQKSAERFMQVEGELWRLKDGEYKKYIKEVDYKDIEIASGEKALVTRKTLEQGGQKQDVTSFVSARKAYFFECTLMGAYESSEVKKLILQIWKIVESEAKKGTR